MSLNFTASFSAACNNSAVSTEAEYIFLLATV